MAESGQYKMPDKFPCVEIFAKDKKEAAEAILTQSSSYGKFTEEGLYGFIHEYDLVSDFAEIKDGLELPDFDLDGFESGWVDDKPGGDGNEDDVPEVPGVAKSKLGDLFQLGEHRLLCGNSTKREDVAWLMDGKKAILMNTDPPYGIDFVGLSQSKGQSKNHKKIANDNLTDGKALQKFLEDSIRTVLPYLEKGTAFYLWHPMLTQGTFFAAAAAADIIVNRQIVWVKPSFVFGRGDYHWKHELCFYGWVKGNQPPFYGERNQHTIWEIGRENDGIHPTQKPVELFTRPIRNHTKAGEICYEPFAGSGSQFIACEKTGRICYGLELEPLYCDVCVSRYCKFIGNNKIIKNGEEIEWPIN